MGPKGELEALFLRFRRRRGRFDEFRRLPIVARRLFVSRRFCRRRRALLGGAAIGFLPLAARLILFAVFSRGFLATAILLRAALLRRSNGA